MELVEIVVGILIFGGGLYTTLMWKHLETKFKYCKEQYMELNDRHKELAERLAQLKSCQHNMETNYIGRFSEVREDMAKNKEELIQVLHKMELSIKDHTLQVHKNNGS